MSIILLMDHWETVLTFCRCRCFKDLSEKQVQMPEHLPTFQHSYRFACGVKYK